MAPPLSVTILYPKSNPFGLAEDAAVIEKLVKHVSATMKDVTLLKPRIADPNEPFVACDIQFHLEIPVFGAIPWAHTNLLLVNPDQWTEAWDGYVHAFDAFLFRDSYSAFVFKNRWTDKGFSNVSERIHLIPWSAPIGMAATVPVPADQKKNELACFIGGSTNKFKYVRELIAHWRAEDPPLVVYTTRNDYAQDLRQRIVGDARVIVIGKQLDERTLKGIMGLYRGHLVVSQGEAFGYAAAHAEASGAFLIANSLPVWREMYTSANTVAWLPDQPVPSNSTPYYTFVEPCPSTLRDDLEHAFAAFTAASTANVAETQLRAASQRWSVTCAAFEPVIRGIVYLAQERRPKKGIVHLPPILDVADCPPITIITPTYNRQVMIDIAFHNLLTTDYPHDKIEWIVIEDNERTPHMASEKIISFQAQVPTLSIKYIPIEGRMSIGEKRNHAVSVASHPIILFMDDDDHYPVTSFRRRVAWLLKGTKRGTEHPNIVCCTTIALYDLLTGHSAVNVPPMELPLSQRVSEATLTFYKSAWEARPFPLVSVAEGDAWIAGREQEVLEIPPQQIIVAFTHRDNQSSRKIPASDQPPSCFWGFPREYLEFVHRLAGVEVVAA